MRAGNNCKIFIFTKKCYYENLHYLPRTKNRFQQRAFDTRRTCRCFIIYCVCVDCNSFLGENIEKPISRAFISGLEGFNDWVAKGNHTLLFVWMSL